MSAKEIDQQLRGLIGPSEADECAAENDAHVHARTGGIALRVYVCVHLLRDRECSVTETMRRQEPAAREIPLAQAEQDKVDVVG